MNQLGFPFDVTPQEVAREKTFGGSIGLCAKAAGLDPKQVTDAVRTSENKAVDKAAWSRWVNDNEGVEWPKLKQIMDKCGNDAPLFWMLHDRGYDLSSLRKQESELEKELRIAREQLAQERAERVIERNLLRDPEGYCMNTYVNYRGEEIGLVHHEVMKKPKKEQAAEYHNGWRVQGIPPGALEEARNEHRRASLAATENGKAPKEWDEEHWLMNSKRKPVRSKPYEVPEAAQECKALAEKSGWLRVEVVELKKEKSAA